MKIREKSHHAAALVMVVSMLFVLSLMGISFVVLTTIENQGAANHSDTCNVSFLAQAGLDYAVLQLKTDFNQDITKVSKNWLYRIDGSPAEGVELTEIYNHPTASCSYQRTIEEEEAGDPVQGRKISGIVADPYHIYTLKILDTASQINVNSQIDVKNPSNAYSIEIMGKLLDNLSVQIAKKYSYRLPDGPFRGMGEAIVRKRNSIGGFKSKLDLVGTYQDANGSTIGSITREDLKYLWDYITVHPTVEEMKVFSLYKNLRSDTLSQETYKEDYRCPVNVNTASKTVLTAIFSGITEGVSGSFISITATEASALAEQIILKRQEKPFVDWDSFYSFLDEQGKEGGVFWGTGQPVPNASTKIAMIKANCDPNVHLKRSNPDYPLYQLINKTELKYYTTELCFFPLGRFEITSLGQILDERGNTVSSAQKYALVKIFDMIHYKSQYDFEGGLSSVFYSRLEDGVWKPNLSYRTNNTYVENQQGLHAFSYGNNIQKSFNTNQLLLDACSQYFGHILPIGYNLKTGDSNLDTAANYRFTLDFNGNYRGKTTSSYLFPSSVSDQEYTQSVPNPAFPLDGNATYSSLLTDGIVFSYAPKNNAKILYYEDNESNAVFPPLKDVSANQGTVLFWFKLNRRWLSQEWRTVFFSTHYYTELPYKIGIQREIQMKVMGPDPNHPDKEYELWPLLRKVQIRVQHKYFCYDTINNDIAKNPLSILYPCISVSRTMTFSDATIDPEKPGMPIRHPYGLYAQEWYHFATRWQKGLSMENFGGSKDSSATFVCGNFYFLTQESGKTITKVCSDYKLDDSVSDSDSETSGEPIVGTGMDDEQPIPDDHFEALYPSLKDKNGFYLAGTGLSDTPEMTIDDFRISNISTGVDNITNYLPSRFPSLNPVKVGSNFCYGVFQGRFAGLSRGTVSSLTWNTRAWGAIVPAKIQRKINGYSWAVWEKLWNMMTDKVGGSDYIRKLVYKPDVYGISHLTVNVERQGAGQGQRWKKKFAFKMTEGAKVVVDKVQKPFSRDTNEVEPVEPRVTPPPSHAFNGLQSSATESAQPLITEILKNWFNFMKTLGYFENQTLDSFEEQEQEKATPVDESGSPYVVDKDEEFRYEILFPIPSAGTLFKSPIVDDVLMVYQPEKIEYQVYLDGGMLP